MTINRLVGPAIVLLVAGHTASAQTAANNPPPTALKTGRDMANAVVVVVVAAAPIYLQPDASRAPLRVAKEGSALRLIERTPDWCNVEFQDPEYGRRVGYIQSKFVQPALNRALDPVDLSVPEAQAPERPGPAAQNPMSTAGTLPRRNSTSNGGMPTKHKVWGSILLGAGTFYIVTAIATRPNQVVCSLGTCYNTNDLRPLWWIIGLGLSGGGAAVLAVGAHSRQDASPSISVTPGGIAVSETIALSRKRLRLWR